MIWMIVMQIIYVQKQQIKLHGAKGQIVRIFTFQLKFSKGKILKIGCCSLKLAEANCFKQQEEMKVLSGF